jgi:hypothetical protein
MENTFPLSEVLQVFLHQVRSADCKALSLALNGD